ncbi:MAG: PilW family protein [Burkholderiales bacterium]|nr:PilW family protein [Burkholderiales bacterium]
MKPRYHTMYAGERGFSLVEILVAMVIALIGMLVIFQSFDTFEAQKRTTTSATDAQESGLMALNAIERDVRLAGYGLFYNNQLVCNRMNVWTGTAALQVPLMPVMITDGGTGSDMIVTSYSTSAFGSLPAQLLLDTTTSAQPLQVNNATRTAGFSVSNMLLVANPTLGRNCTRLQVSGTTLAADGGSLTIATASATAAPANPPAATNLFATAPNPVASYGNSPAEPSIVINMGAFTRNQFSVVINASNRDGELQQLDMTNASATSVTLASGIVNMQAQLGVSAAATTQEINNWVNPTGTWAPTAISIADIGRVKAIRVAIVSRSSQMERTTTMSSGNVTSTCTTPVGTVNNGPCAWDDTGTTAAPQIDLSGDTNWQRYRYRVYETIIPIRNVMWQTF